MVWVVVVLVGVAAREAVGKAWAGRVAAAREEEEGVVVVRVAAAVARAAWAAEARAVGAKAAVAMAVVAQVVVAMVAAARVVPMADSTEVEARVAVALAGVAVMAAVATALAVVVTVEVVVWAPATVVEEVVAVAMAAVAATAAVAAATAAMRVEEEDVAALEEAAVTGSAGDWVMAGADRHQSHSHQSCSHPSRPQRSRRPRERAWERWRRGLLLFPTERADQSHARLLFCDLERRCLSNLRFQGSDFLACNPDPATPRCTWCGGPLLGCTSDVSPAFNGRRMSPVAAASIFRLFIILRP